MSKQAGFVEVELDGKEYLLRFDFNAVSDIEEYFDKGLGEIVDDKRIGFNTIRVLYWGGLKWKVKGLTVQRVGQMLQHELTENEKALPDLMQPIAKALKASGLMGGKKKDEDNDNEEPEKN